MPFEIHRLSLDSRFFPRKEREKEGEGDKFPRTRPKKGGYPGCKRRNGARMDGKRVASGRRTTNPPAPPARAERCDGGGKGDQWKGSVSRNDPCSLDSARQGGMT